MQIRSKNVSVLVNGTVLNHSLARFQYLQNLIVAAVKEEYLQIERPALHIVVKVVHIRVVGLFVVSLPLEIFRQKTCQCGLSRANVSCYSDVHSVSFYLRLN